MKADFTVQAPSRNYPVFVRDGLPGHELEEFLESVKADQVYLIVDEHVKRVYGEHLMKTLGSRIDTERVWTVPSGEGSKNREEWAKITDFLLTNGVRRNSRVLVAGGGVTGDLAGFAAATTMRGVPLIHIPTTLLAMVDSSIGGKTGINHSSGKNLIGSFYQPESIFIHSGFLESLQQKEWVNGLSEILKYGAIQQPDIFRICRDLFLDNTPSHDDSKLVELIRRCAKIKADVVAADERENRLRMILNFGHTFGHALERQGGYNIISHGEAVFVGMLAASRYSNMQTASLNLEQLEIFRALYNIDPAVVKWRVEDLVEAMYHDKKRSSDRLKVVLLQEWGTPYVTECKDTRQVEEAWQYALEQFR